VSGVSDCSSVLLCFVRAIRAPLGHAAQWPVAQWPVVAGGFAVGTLWWQVRRASKVERGCRGCRTACTPVSFVNEIIFQSSSVCRFVLCDSVLCCAVRVCCAVLLRCGQSLQKILAVRCIVVAGALCVESGERVSRVSDCSSVLCCGCHSVPCVLRCARRAVLRCVMLRSGQSLRAVSL
jgi:hypothetical protein